MAKTFHIQCPNCGGLLSSRGERVLSCKYCGDRSLVIVPDWTPSYYLKPKLDLTAARRALVNLFKARDVESGMLKTAKFEGAELFFVPLYHLRARRVGTFLLKPQPPSPRAAQTYQTTVSISRAGLEETWRVIRDTERMMEAKPDTRVILSDVIRSMPAVRLEEWGVDGIEPDKIMLDHAAEPRRYNREEMDRVGTVLEPVISCEERLEQIYRMPGLIRETDQTEIVDQRVDLFYYPVWRARWRYQNKSFQTIVDAITGKFLFARAPAKQSARVFWLLACSAAVGFSIGKLLAFLKILIFTGLAGMWILAILSTLLLFFLAFGWNMFRYSTELVYQGDYVSVEWIGRPPETIFEKMANKMSKFLWQAARARRSNWMSGG